jgi:succinoglycan biosynthesis protein ExoW
MTKLGVVIPYFQLEPQILSDAVASVLGQNLPPDCTVHIVIVDDESPVSAHEELAGTSCPSGFEIHIVCQANAGPGAARNAALEQLDGLAIDFVAFLDSDDIWQPYHLRSALLALGSDADFYFSNHTRFNIATSFFEDKTSTESALSENSGVESFGPPLGNVYRWTSTYAAEAFAQEYVSQTSTVVARWERARALRFDTDLKNAGEDALFWIDLAMVSRAIKFSRSALVHCGRGINIFHGAYNWHSNAGTDKFGYLVLMGAKIRARGVMGERSRKNAEKAELIFSYLTIRGLFEGRAPNRALFRSLFAANPITVLRMPLRFFQYLVIRKKIDWSA